MTTEKRLVWDLPLRLFHWLLVLSIAASWYTAENSEEYITAGENVYSYTQIHFWLGYWTLGLIIFRILWGFFGPKHSRFTSFLAGPSRLLKYGRTLLKRDSAPAVGHNPLGGWMVVVMILMVGAQAVTGLFLIDNTEIYSAPYHPAVSGETAGALGRFHHINFDVLLWIIGLHVLAIVFYIAWKRQNLVGAMVTGRKASLSAHEAITGSQWLKALILILLSAGAVYVVLKNAPPPPAAEYY